MDDQRPAPRFAVGQMVLCDTRTDGWVGPFAVVDMRFAESEIGEFYRGWFYRLIPAVPLRDELMDAFAVALPGEHSLRPYDPPADQSYDDLMAGLKASDPTQVDLSA